VIDVQEYIDPNGSSAFGRWLDGVERAGRCENINRIGENRARQFLECQAGR